MTISFDPHHTCFTFAGAGNPAPNPETVTGEVFTLQYLNGFMTTTEENILSDGLEPISSRITLQEASDAIGEWMGVFSGSRGTFIVCADHFGYQPVFYRSLVTSRGSWLFVGSSVDSVSRAASRYGGPLEIDKDELLSYVGTTDPWSVTMQSSQSMESSTKILLPGESLVIKNNFWSLRKTKLFKGKEDYYSLIERGVQRAVRQLQVASRLDVDQRRINLSGGKDSRIVLALLAASGNISNFSVTSMNPRTWSPESARPIIMADLRVANGLRNEFGLSWTTPLKSRFQPLGFEQSLDFWHAYRGHRNFKFRATGGLYHQKGTNLELRGAAGETFRGFKAVSTLLNKLPFENNVSSLESDTLTLIKHLYGRRIMSTDELALAAQRTYGLFAQLESENISQALQRRYSVFRNRSHFGHVRYSMAQGQYPVLPLSQPEFVQAAEILSEEERRLGKVAYDIIELACPELNELPFDDGNYWDESLLSLRRRRGFDENEKQESLNEFYALDESAVTQRVKAKEATAREILRNTAFNPQFETVSRIKQILVDLNEIGSSGPKLTAKQQRWLIEGVDSGRFKAGVLLSKLQSAWMAVEPECQSNEVLIQCGQRNIESIFTACATLPRGKKSRERKHPQFQLPVELEEGKVTAGVVIYGTISEPMEVKFRFLKDGEVIEETSYSKIPSARFDLTQGDHKFRIEANVRYGSNHNAVYRFFSRVF